jgi:hypothetical protein
LQPKAHHDQSISSITGLLGDNANKTEGNNGGVLGT